MLQYDDTADDFLFAVRMADIYEGSIQALASFYNDGKKLNGPIEALTLQIKYKDIHDEVKQLNLPVVSNALTWAVENK